MRVGDVGVTGGDDRKRSLRFTLATDIVLLQEVGLRKPWASPHGTIRDTWEQIAAAVTATINNARDESEAARVDHGACKRRYDVLMEAFAKDELKSMRAKGSPDLYVRREELLTELSMQVRHVMLGSGSSTNGGARTQMITKLMHTVCGDDICAALAAPRPEAQGEEASERRRGRSGCAVDLVVDFRVPTASPRCRADACDCVCCIGSQARSP